MKTLLLVSVLLLGGCTWFREPPPEPARRVVPGSRIIYNSGVGDTLWSVCDGPNLIYLTEKSPQMVVVPNGCVGRQP